MGRFFILNIFLLAIFYLGNDKNYISELCVFN